MMSDNESKRYALLQKRKVIVLVTIFIGLAVYGGLVCSMIIS